MDEIIVSPTVTKTQIMGRDTWVCECGNVNSNKWNHRVITVGNGGPFGGESGYDTCLCLKCGAEGGRGRSWYDRTRTPEKKIDVSPTPTPMCVLGKKEEQ